MRKLSHRLLMHLRKTQSSHGVDWEQLCVAHAARPQFIFELLDETVRLRLLARSQRDQSVWLWTGHEWQLHEAKKPRPPGASPRSWTTRAWSRRPNGCASWTGSRPSPGCGSATPTKAS